MISAILLSLFCSLFSLHILADDSYSRISESGACSWYSIVEEGRIENRESRIGNSSKEEPPSAEQQHAVRCDGAIRDIVQTRLGLIEI